LSNFFSYIWETIVAIFTGTASLSFFVILLLLFLRFLLDAFIPSKLQMLLNILFFPGSFMHQVIQTIAVRACGYDVKVNFHMAFDRDYASQSIKGDLTHVSHAAFIGLSPFLNMGLVIAILKFSNDISGIFLKFGMPLMGTFLKIYLLLCFAFFSIPDVQDLMLPFYTLTVGYSEFIALLMVSLLFFVFAVGVWGWLIPSINFLFFMIFVLYLVKRRQDSNYKVSNLQPIKRNQSRNEGDEILLLEV